MDYLIIILILLIFGVPVMLACVGNFSISWGGYDKQKHVEQQNQIDALAKTVSELQNQINQK